MSFQTIAEETRLPPHEVEHLVMKALRFVSPQVAVLCAYKRLQPKTHSGLSRSSRPEGLHYLGATSRIVDGANWSAGRTSCCMGNEIAQS